MKRLSEKIYAMAAPLDLRILLTGLCLALSACSLEAGITSLGSELGGSPALPQERKEPDFIAGEVVTTTEGTPGYQVKAVFGEVTERQTTSTGWRIDGVFYE